MNIKFSTNLKDAYAEQGKDTGRGFPIFLSQRFGVTTQAARDWLNDKSYPRIETLLEMAADLGMLIFDITRRNPENGDYVAARLEDGSCVFRRYMQEGIRYLMPLNHTYENYRGNFGVIGTLDYAVLDF